MKKIKDKSKIWIIISFIILIVVVIILGVQCGKKQETDLDKPSDKVEDSVGLEIADPEEADKTDEDKQVEFIAPDDENFSSGDNEQGSGNQGSSNQGNGSGQGNNGEGDSNNTNNNDNTEDNEESTGSEDTGNLEENPDDSSQYGSFF